MSMAPRPLASTFAVTRSAPWAALVLSVVALVLSALPVFGWAAAVVATLALTVAIAALGVRATPTGASIAALIVAGIALYLVMFVSVAQLVATEAERAAEEASAWAERTDPEAYPDPEPSPARDLALTTGHGGTPRSPLTFGQSVTIGDTTGDVWTVSVGAPIDVTAATEATFGVPAEIGNYFAIPVTITNAGDHALDPFLELDVSPSLDFANEAGAPRYSFSFPNAEGLAELGDIGPLAPGESAQYFQTIEIDAASVPSQRVLMSVGTLELHWGAPPPG
jgi:hypothetical protein